MSGPLVSWVTRWCLNCGKAVQQCHCRETLVAHDRDVQVVKPEPLRPTVTNLARRPGGLEFGRRRRAQ